MGVGDLNSTRASAPLRAGGYFGVPPLHKCHFILHCHSCVHPLSLPRLPPLPRHRSLAREVAFLFVKVSNRQNRMLARSSRLSPLVQKGLRQAYPGEFWLDPTLTHATVCLPPFSSSLLPCSAIVGRQFLTPPQHRLQSTSTRSKATVAAAHGLPLETASVSNTPVQHKQMSGGELEVWSKEFLAAVDSVYHATDPVQVSLHLLCACAFCGHRCDFGRRWRQDRSTLLLSVIELTSKPTSMTSMAHACSHLYSRCLTAE
eukprot:1481290-Rhodomonas_salina.1